MDTIPKEGLEIIKILEITVKRTKGIIGETITRHILKDTFSDRQTEKRVFLTDIEVELLQNLDKYVAGVKESFIEMAKDKDKIKQSLTHKTELIH